MGFTRDLAAKKKDVTEFDLKAALCFNVYRYVIDGHRMFYKKINIMSAHVLS